MIIKIIAYIIAIFFFPIMSGLIMVVSLPLAFFANILKNISSTESGRLIQQALFVVSGFLSNFISVWILSKIFILLNVKPTLLMVIFTGIPFILYQWKEISKYQGQRAEIEIADLWGGIIGIILAGIYILK